MPPLTVTKTYVNGNILIESDLDAVRNSLLTYFNVTKIDSSNIQSASLTGSLFATGSVGISAIAAGAATTTTIAANAVLPIHRASVNYITGTYQSGITFQNQANANVTVDTVTLTVSGSRPVLVGILSSPLGQIQSVQVSPQKTQKLGFSNGTTSWTMKIEDANYNAKTWPSTAFYIIDYPAAGSVTYTWFVNPASAAIDGYRMIVWGTLFALEL